MPAENGGNTSRIPCAWDDASYISRFFFHWVRPVLALGSNIDEPNLPEVSKEDDFETITHTLCANWDHELTTPHQVSLARALWKTFRPLWLRMVFLEAFESSCKLLQTAGIWWLLRYFLLNEEVWRGYLFSAVLVASFTGSNVAHHHLYWRGWRLGMRIRQTFLGLLFRKSMRLRLSSLGTVSVGAIVNIASNDIERFQSLGPFAIFLVSVPLTVLASLIIGVLVIGPAFAAGYVVLLILLPLQLLVSRIFGRTRRQTAKSSDKRIKLTAQSISGARLMKMQAWELAFLDRVGAIRETELQGVAKANYARSFNFALMLSISALMSFLTFVVHHQTGGELRIPDVFMALSLYSVLQNLLFIQFAQALQAVMEARVSLQRITSFLLMPEANMRLSASPDGVLPSVPAQPLVCWKDSSFSYAPPEADAHVATKNLPSAFVPLLNRDSPVVLHNITLSLMPGELIVVIGPVGAGKTSLLLAMLGELHAHVKAEESVERCVSWGLAPQQPWIYSGTIKDNILLSLPFDHLLYSEVLEACCLKQDIALLQHGDMTRVGDRGVALSGGQRARVGLARLCYAGLMRQGSQAKAFLLDDPLSAVDPAVASALFKNVIADSKSLLAPFARVLVTHQLQFLSAKEVSRIVILSSSGHMLAYDTYENLKDSDVLKQLMAEDENAPPPSPNLGVSTSSSMPALISTSASYPELPPASMSSFTSCVTPLLDSTTNTRTIAPFNSTLLGVSIAPLSPSSSDSTTTSQAHDHPNFGSFASTTNHNDCSSSASAPSAASFTLDQTHPHSPFSVPPTPTETPLSSSGSSSSFTPHSNRLRPSYATYSAFAASQTIPALTSSTFIAPCTPTPAVTHPFSDTPKVAVTPLESYPHDATASSCESNDSRDSSSINNGSSENTGAAVANSPAPASSDVGIDQENSEPRSLPDAPVEATALLNSVSSNGATTSSSSSAVTPSLKPTAVAVQVSSHAGVQEDRDQGAISWRTYFSYVRAAGVCATLLAVLLMTMGQIMAIGTSFWLGKWAANAYSLNTRVWIGVFGGFAVATVLFGWVRAFYSLRVCITASQKLHDTALTQVFRAPIAFFDMCPLGRILNRFSKDLGSIDDLMPYTILDFFGCVLTVIGAVILSSVVNPFLIIFFVPLMLYFTKLRSYYIRSSREIKRLEAASRSPIFAYFAEVLDGLTVIRAFEVQAQFTLQFAERVNANTRAYFQFIATSRWLGFNLDILTFFLIAFGSFGSVIVHHYGFLEIDGALLGVSLLYLIQLGGLFQWCVRQSAEVENQMVSVERLVAYGRLVPEAALEGETGLKLPEEQLGVDIEFRHVTCRYRPELNPVLKDVCVKFPAGARCAIVGRTGAGKSSIVEALFRLMESEGENCGVYLGGQPASRMGLHPLRRLIGAIPQTPFLFAGTVRDNLDPLNKHSDDMLWAGLRNVQMADQIKEAGGLEAEVGEGGGMLSVGERQLLCLARALLQRPKILVLDEATANVDMKTDEMIQRALRMDFRKATVLVIAHRLHTIIDSDIVLVLNDGQVAEVGSPFSLLQKYRAVHGQAESGAPESPLVSFARMVGETGPTTEQMLRNRARQAFQANSKRSSVEV